MLFHSVSGIPPPLPGGSKRLAWSRPLYIGGKKLILHGRGGTDGNGNPAARTKANKLAAGSAVKRFGLTLEYA